MRIKLRGVVLCLIAGALILWLAAVVRGQKDNTALALVLAKAGVAEIDLRGADGEYELMWHILRAKVSSPGMLGVLAQRYNSIFKKDGRGRYLVRTDRARWVRDLRADASEPEGWPKDAASWDRWPRDAWLEVLQRAEDFVNDPGRHPCPRATHYGGRCDDNKYACDELPPCCKRVWCGKPKAYYAQAYHDCRSC